MIKNTGGSTLVYNLATLYATFYPSFSVTYFSSRCPEIENRCIRPPRPVHSGNKNSLSKKATSESKPLPPRPKLPSAKSFGIRMSTGSAQCKQNYDYASHRGYLGVEHLLDARNSNSPYTGGDLKKHSVSFFDGRATDRAGVQTLRAVRADGHVHTREGDLRPRVGHKTCRGRHSMSVRGPGEH